MEVQDNNISEIILTAPESADLDRESAKGLNF